MESSATNPSTQKQDTKFTIDSILNTCTPTVLTHHPNAKSVKKRLDDLREEIINEKLIPEASELYPFYITFKCDDGHFDWGFYPARTRREAVEQFLLSGVEHAGVHMIAKDGYKNPNEYIDEDEIQLSIHESEEDLTVFCAKLTEKETQLNKVFAKIRG